MAGQRSKASLVATLCGVAVLAGCTITGGCWVQRHSKRTEQLSASMGGVRALEVDTSFGEVKIVGTETNECSVTAYITANAPTIEEANQLADQVEVRLEKQGTTLVVKTLKPRLARNRSIGVDFDIAAPRKTAIKCDTSFGEVAIENIEGDVKAHTSFGNVGAENVTGKIDLDTSHGEIVCKNISTGDLVVKTSFGGIDAAFADSCPPSLSAMLDTSFGDIRVSPPPNFAGAVDMETSFGKVETSLAVTLQGEISKEHIKGTIGTGEGKLVLKTSFGSIKLK